MKKKLKRQVGFEAPGLILPVALCALFLTFGQRVVAVDETLKRTPDLDSNSRRSSFLINLARVNVGATIKSKPDQTQAVDLIDDDGEQKGDQIRTKSPTFLVNDDSSIAAMLQPGKISYIISMSQLQVINRFNFYNYTAAGTFTVFTSKEDLDFDNSKWQPAGQKIEFDGDGAYESRFAPTEARYVKVDFEISREGNIAAFGLFGAIRNFGFRGKPDYVETPHLPTPEIINYSYADLYTARSSVAYVSSIGEGCNLSSANNMIDNNIATSFTFAQDDPHPTLVVDMADRPSIRRVSANFIAPQGQLDVYLVNSLPGVTKPADVADFIPQPGTLLAASGIPWFARLLGQMQVSEGGILRIPESFFESQKAFRNIKIVGGHRHTAINFDMESIRYIVLRFLPQNPGEEPVIVWEVNAFGNTRTRRFIPDYGVPRGLTGAVNQGLNVPNDPPVQPPKIPTTSK